MGMFILVEAVTIIDIVFDLNKRQNLRIGLKYSIVIKLSNGLMVANK